MDSKKNSTQSLTPDIDYLKSILGDDKDSINEVISIFVETVPMKIRDLKQSVDEMDHDRIKRISHSLISELQTMGINSVVKDIKEINNRSAEMDDLRQKVERIADIVDRSIVFYKNML